MNTRITQIQITNEIYEIVTLIKTLRKRLNYLESMARTTETPKPESDPTQIPEPEPEFPKIQKPEFPKIQKPEFPKIQKPEPESESDFENYDFESESDSCSELESESESDFENYDFESESESESESDFEDDDFESESESDFEDDEKTTNVFKWDIDDETYLEFDTSYTYKDILDNIYSYLKKDGHRYQDAQKEASYIRKYLDGKINLDDELESDSDIEDEDIDSSPVKKSLPSSQDFRNITPVINVIPEEDEDDIEDHVNMYDTCYRQRTDANYIKSLELIQVDGEHDCCICMDQVTEAPKLKCGHFFHLDCVEQWAESQNKCPMCRDQWPLAGENEDICVVEL